MAINASLLVCDQIRVENNGKLLLIGVYSGNIAIPFEPIPQISLTFLFSVDCPIDEYPSKVSYEVTLPNGSPTRQEITSTPLEPNPNHTRWHFRHVLSVENQPLYTGKIKARVLFNDQELEISSPWIEMMAPAIVTNAFAPPSEQSQTVERPLA
jgi:hypothetical protein